MSIPNWEPLPGRMERTLIPTFFTRESRERRWRRLRGEEGQTKPSAPPNLGRLRRPADEFPDSAYKIGDSPVEVGRSGVSIRSSPDLILTVLFTLQVILAKPSAVSAPCAVVSPYFHLVLGHERDVARFELLEPLLEAHIRVHLATSYSSFRYELPKKTRGLPSRYSARRTSPNSTE